jgi:DNA-binding winged helix-turn-helix (wHTH) protein/TolB-like protein
MSDRRPSSLLRFGLFELDLASEELRRAGTPVRLQPQPWTVLVRLVSNAGRLVTREELQREVWGDRAVEADQGLNYCVREIRRALGDQAENPIFVETVPRRGYRFVAPVEVIEEAPVATAASTSLVSARMQPGDAGVGEGPDRPAPTENSPPWPSRAAWVLVLTAVALACLAWLGLRSGRGAPPAAPVLLAVLPFAVEESIASDDSALIASGLTHEMITELGRLDPERMSLVSLDAARRISSHPEGVQRLRETLGVDLVLRGTVRLAQETSYLHLWLENSADQQLLWTQRFQAGSGKQFVTQRLLAERAAQSLSEYLGISLAAPLGRLENPIERQAYLRGRYLLDKGEPPSAQASIELFDQAITADPRSARAYAGLAEAIVGTWDRERIQGEGREAALRAVALDETLGSPHLTLAWITAAYEWDWEASLRHIHRALDLAPDSARAHGVHSYLLLRRPGNEEEGLVEARRAAELNPVMPVAQCDLAWAYLYARRFEAAMDQADLTLALNPGDFYAALAKIVSLERLERRQEAAEAGRVLMMRNRASRQELESLANAPDPGAALNLFWRWWQTRLEVLRATAYIPWDGLVTAAIQLGEDEEAIRLILEALDDRPEFLIFLSVDPRFDPLRGDPAFEEIVERIERGGDKADSSIEYSQSGAQRLPQG